MLRKIAPLLTIMFVCRALGSSSLQAQVTTGAIAGTVVDTAGAGVEAATVTAEHLPSGTKYTTLSKKGGVFNIPGVRAGGPYKVTIEHVGLKTQIVDNITIALGDSYSVNAEMVPEVTELSAVTVSATRRRAMADRNGATTNINSRMMATLPTITRSITDFTRVTPQSNGTNFAGRDGRLNNVTVDGANLNNNFGLSNDLLREYFAL
jgi:hypothetical protein